MACETTGRVLRDSLPRNLSWLHFPSLCHTYLSQYFQPLYITVHCHLQPNPVHARSWLHNPSSHLQVRSPAWSKRRQPWIVQCKTTTSLSRLCCQGVLLQEKEETCKQKPIFSPLLFHCSRQVVPLPRRGDPNAPPRFSPEICGVVTQTLTRHPTVKRALLGAQRSRHTSPLQWPTAGGRRRHTHTEGRGPHSLPGRPLAARRGADGRLGRPGRGGPGPWARWGGAVRWGSSRRRRERLLPTGPARPAAAPEPPSGRGGRQGRRDRTRAPQLATRGIALVPTASAPRPRC